ncbi:MAG: hypothetical protein ABIF10_00205 [Candidatus Woesearchaeota archaeon]
MLDALSPYDEDHHKFGWRVPLDLHNGNVYVLVFWRGKLMRLDDAPKGLCRNYYDRYRGRQMNVYEWTLLKKRILADLA